MSRRPHRVNPRRPRYPRYREPLPSGGLTGTCMVGRLLVPVLGARRVEVIAAAGGLLPYVAGRLAARLAGAA